MAGTTVAIVGLVLVVGSATGTIKLFGKTARTDLVLHKAQFERLQLTITERGTLESAENKDVVCRVKARSASSTVATTIRWVIDDGTEVQKGDKLLQLDDSGLYEQLKDQKIKLDTAYAAYIQADTQYSIVESENKSAIATAKLNLELAEIDLDKYEKGDYIQTEKEIDGRRMIAQSDLSMWEERAAWSGRMSKPGRRYVTSAQAQADDARLKSAKIALSKVEEEMRVLQKYTGLQERKKRQGTIDEAKRALERVVDQAKAKEVQADADRKSKRSVYEQELGRHQDIEDEIKKCVVAAPQSGLVVYYIPEQSRFGSGSQQSIVAQGEPVREGQKLMRIPDLTKMLVNTKVHEAMIGRVRGERWQKTGFSEGIQTGLLMANCQWARLAGLKAFDTIREDFLETNKNLEQVKVAEGQPAQVRIDAFPGRTFSAEVKTVATVASQQDWWASDVKVYQTMVAVKDTVPGLKPGMSAEVVIFTDSARDHCLTVPVQSLLGTVDMGNKRRVYVQTPRGPEAREVTVGLSNEKMAEIESGLEEGDLVVVNPRALLSEKEKAQFATDTGKAKGKDGKGKDGKGKDGKGAWPGKGGGPPNGKMTNGNAPG